MVRISQNFLCSDPFSGNADDRDSDEENCLKLRAPRTPVVTGGRPGAFDLTRCNLLLEIGPRVTTHHLVLFKTASATDFSETQQMKTKAAKDYSAGLTHLEPQRALPTASANLSQLCPH